MTFRFILLVLPALTLAYIQVDITGINRGHIKDLKVNYSGMDISIISENERTTFNVTENNLKNAVSVRLGKRPDDVFVRSSTSLDDPYSKHGWKQVSRTIVPISCKILSASVNRIVMVSKTFENKGTDPAVYNVNISQSVANTVSSSWSTSGELSPMTKTVFNITIKVDNFSEKIDDLYKSLWGQNTQQSYNVTIGGDSYTYVMLQPGQQVIVQLTALKSFVQVEMEYEASLSGQTVSNYTTRYNGNHLYSIPIDVCMSGIGLSNLRTAQEIITIEYFSNSEVMVGNILHGKLLMAANS